MIKRNEQAEALNPGRDWGGRYYMYVVRIQQWAEFFFLPLTELSILGYVEHLFIVQIRYSTFARNTLTPPLPPSPITSLSLHPASFPYSLVDDECPAVG